MAFAKDTIIPNSTMAFIKRSGSYGTLGMTHDGSIYLTYPQFISRLQWKL